MWSWLVSLLGESVSGAVFKVTAGVAIAVLLVVCWVLYQSGQRTREELGRVKADLELAESALEQLRRFRASEAELVADSAEEQERLTVKNRKLEWQLREALKNANFDLDTVLPGAVADALCLRWRVASGFGGGVDAAGGADAGAGHTVAAVCAGWRGKLTLGDVVEWAGLLLDHAGAERVDKAALRRWSEEAGAVGKVE